MRQSSWGSGHETSHKDPRKTPLTLTENVDWNPKHERKLVRYYVVIYKQYGLKYCDELIFPGNPT